MIQKTFKKGGTLEEHWKIFLCFGDDPLVDLLRGREKGREER
jgi:hypothetical protein